jgi:hypothetical protein
MMPPARKSMSPILSISWAHRAALAGSNPERRVGRGAERLSDQAYRRNPERFVAGPPIAARPPQRVLVNPLDAAPPTLETVLETPDDQLAALWPAAAVSSIPVINLPGAPTNHEQLANAT